MHDRRRFEVILQAQPADVPAEVRLRRALKYLLRACGLRCVRAVELLEEEAPAASVVVEQPRLPE